MKRIVSVLLITALIAVCAPAFAKENMNIVATTFPQYDWIRQIMGDKIAAADLTLLVAGGSDIHSYQPSAKDMIAISTCDMIIYVGGTSDKWVADALANAQNPDLVAISMMEAVEAREEEQVEGMQPEEEEHGEAEIEYDEHVWLSLRNAKTICLAIADGLGRLDPDNAEYYAQNARGYADGLDALDKEYLAMVESAKRNTLLFADRFPFRYLTDDYGLDYYAAFAGCSAETEASFETVAFLAEKLDEMELPVVLVIDGGNHDLARTVLSCTRDANRPILEMDSIQSVRDTDVSYISIMENNLAVLQTALN